MRHASSQARPAGAILLAVSGGEGGRRAHPETPYSTHFVFFFWVPSRPTGSPSLSGQQTPFLVLGARVEMRCMCGFVWGSFPRILLYVPRSEGMGD